MILAYVKYLNFFDFFIWLAGFVMLGVQIYLRVCHQRYSLKTLEKWRSGTLYFCEFFPLAGLLGTMLALLVTLSSIGDGKPEIGAIMNNFAPALTSTVSGLFMLILNLTANYILGLSIKE